MSCYIVVIMPCNSEGASSDHDNGAQCVPPSTGRKEGTEKTRHGEVREGDEGGER